MIYLVEFTLGSTAYRFATRGAILGGLTAGADYFEERVLNPGSLERHLFTAGRVSTGGATINIGTIELANADGILDGLFDVAFDNVLIAVRYGDESGAYSTFKVLFVGVIKSIGFNLSTVSIAVTDTRTNLAAQPQQTLTYAGNNSLPNGVEGVADLQGKFKPIVYGYVFNIAPPCVNTSKLVYQISSKACTAWTVRVAGQTIAASARYYHLADLLAATPTAGYFIYYLGDDGDGAYFRLGSSPGNGLVTADVYDDSTQDGSGRHIDCTGPRVMKRVLGITGANAPLDGWHTNYSSGTEFEEMGVYVGLDGANTGDLLDLLALSLAGASWTSARDGTFALWRLAGTGASQGTLDATDILADGDGITVQRSGEGGGSPPAAIDWYTRKNYNPQAPDSLAGSVTPDLVASYGPEYQKTHIPAVATNTGREIESFYTVAGGNASPPLGQRLRDLFSPTSGIFRRYVTVQISVARMVNLSSNGPLEVGWIISVQYPRLGLNFKIMQIVGMVEDYQASTVTLHLWG